MIGPQVPPVINTLVEGRPAEQAGLRSGDRIVAIDGEKVEFFQDLERNISERPYETVTVSIVRDGQSRDVELTVGAYESNGVVVGRIGIGSPEYNREAIGDRLYVVRRAGPIEGIGVGIVETWDRSVLSLRFLARMVTGDVSLRNASGPIMIAAYAGDFAQAGFNRFLQFLAMISISLGIVNLLPVPILDGGQIVMCAVEGIKGKPLSLRAAMIGQQIGLAMLMALMGLVFYNDITRLLGS